MTAGTVEEAVLHLLQAKLNLFELVIGEIDMILGNLDEEREFEDVVADLWAESADMGDFRQRMEELGDRLLQAKAAYQEQQATTTRSSATALLRISERVTCMDGTLADAPRRSFAAGGVPARLPGQDGRRLGRSRAAGLRRAAAGGDGIADGPGRRRRRACG